MAPGGLSTGIRLVILSTALLTLSILDWTFSTAGLAKKWKPCLNKFRRSYSGSTSSPSSNAKISLLSDGSFFSSVSSSSEKESSFFSTTSSPGDVIFSGEGESDLNLETKRLKNPGLGVSSSLGLGSEDSALSSSSMGSSSSVSLSSVALFFFLFLGCFFRSSSTASAKSPNLPNENKSRLDTSFGSSGSTGGMASLSRLSGLGISALDSLPRWSSEIRSSTPLSTTFLPLKVFFASW